MTVQKSNILSQVKHFQVGQLFTKDSSLCRLLKSPREMDIRE